MHKMIVLYREPADPEQFLRHYHDVHLPLVAKIPGLVRSEVTRLNRTLMGEKFFLMAELYFADADSFKAAMKSPENAATGADLANFAEGLATVMIGETIG
ncbi:ethyl tert-butyl ether degradation protein EthD [Sandarakinorhabdus cyanobacteriorum]|uniref:Ethyl tert-butyl ether degradation protein EthD n=1 Tax=Sandarakinorhabdus cyanobacteriorum TaxID=1981098 RepID=A0A255YK37_9SPHN|nr:EthD family reductase [Sandarakinorhabdus cyanobacteriorum]OYQ29558.1 ethyl tert-butyl ether degradation protein EthD [Sandarakinorhabdus cyanobacteriorum]